MVKTLNNDDLNLSINYLNKAIQIKGKKFLNFIKTRVNNKNYFVNLREKYDSKIEEII